MRTLSLLLQVLLGLLRNPRVNELAPGTRFWAPERAWEELGGYYEAGAVPAVLQVCAGLGSLGIGQID